MPIKPESRARYPKGWREIVARVRERSGDRCEGSPAFPDCRVPNGAVGYRDAGRWVRLGTTLDECSHLIDAGWADGFKITRTPQQQCRTCHARAVLQWTLDGFIKRMEGAV